MIQQHHVLKKKLLSDLDVDMCQNKYLSRFCSIATPCSWGTEDKPLVKEEKVRTFVSLEFFVGCFVLFFNFYFFLFYFLNYLTTL